jgi:hypothetical protein
MNSLRHKAIQGLSATVALLGLGMIAAPQPGLAFNVFRDRYGANNARTACQAGLGCRSLVDGATTETFDGDQLNRPYRQALRNTVEDTVVQRSAIGSYVAPRSDSTQYLALGFSTRNSVTLNFGREMDYFGLYWGSTDDYNDIAFLDKSGKVLASYTGADIAGDANGDQIADTTNAYIHFFSDVENGQTFNSVVLFSNGNSFESDNHAYRNAAAPTGVPEPTTLLGLVLSGSVVGICKHRQKRQVMDAGSPQPQEINL